MSQHQPKKPTLFEMDDQNITVTTSKDPENNQSISPTSDETEAPSSQLPPNDHTPLTSKFFSIGTLFLTSILGLFGLWAFATLISGLETLIARNDVLGYAAIILTILALITLTLLVMREIASLWSLKRLGTLRATAQQTYENNQLKPARAYLKKIKSLYEEKPEHSWMLDRLKTQENEIMDGRELLDLIDKEIGTPLDQKARITIKAAAKQVSLITAIAPGPFIDMAAVTIINIRMIRKLAAIYGVRPGFWGQIRLSRNVLSHLALTGGIALTSDLLQPLIGTSIAAKLSKKLGEGLFNGALTIRIGLSAIELTRPIPHLSTKPHSFKDLVTSSLKP